MNQRQTVNLSERIHALSPEKRALLAMRLKEKGEDFNTFPLSFAQERLWLIDQLEPGNSAYNLPAVLRFKGCLDIVALRDALSEIIRRHEILRTSFPIVDGKAVQVIAPAKPFQLPVIDLSMLSETESETKCRVFINREARQSFNLAQGPLLSACLLCLSKGEHLLLFTMHHIIGDAWSSGILIHEVTALYDAYIKGMASPLTDLPIQYVDFAVWQRQWLRDEVLESQLKYWREEMEGAPPVLGLLTDRPRPNQQRFHGATVPFRFSTAKTEILKRLCLQEGVTLFMLLLAAFKVLLFRYTRQTDLVIGTPIAGRNRSELERLIGFLVNTLIIRTDISGDPGFHVLLARVREVVLGAYTHQDLPFDLLVRSLNPDRDLSHTPLFQVLFALQNATLPPIHLPDLEVSIEETEGGTVKFDFSLILEERKEGLIGFANYNTELFETASIECLVAQFQSIIDGIIDDPNQRISRLPLMSSDERERFLKELLNHTDKHALPTENIVDLFVAQVERSPQSLAIVQPGGGGRSLSFQELNRKANRLAHHLQKLGVGPNVIVGICLERSLEMVIGILGVLKAGGAYLPLDPIYPRERLKIILEDSRCRLVVTEKRLSQSFELDTSDIQIVYLDLEQDIIAHESIFNPISAARPDDLAYVIYTSGTTGQPKGVMIPNRALTHYVITASKEFEINASDRVLQFASLSFDAAAEEIYPCLLNGATLVLRTDEMLSSVPTFLAACRHLKITILDLPTAYWHQLMRQIISSSLEVTGSLRLVIIGGERVTPELVAKWRLYCGEDVRLLNTYGPTEATIVATMWEAPSIFAYTPREIPIGKPITNVAVYVLDQDSNLMPPGIPGELHIGGAGVARGYLNDPELTAQKFVTITSCGLSNGNSKEVLLESQAQQSSTVTPRYLYKTGDLVRYLPDGNIEFLGRLDNQVKIRGFRVELGDIEFCLRRHSAIRDVVVVARYVDIELYEKRLVAYFTSDQSLTTSDLRAFMKDRLAEYMLPTFFIKVEAMPLTPNGKIDQNALPDPALLRPELDSGYVAPQSMLEAILAEMWLEVLIVEPIGVHDNFFELGGDSLRAAIFINRLQQKLDEVIYVAALFSAPTINEFAKYLEASHSVGVAKIAEIENATSSAIFNLSQVTIIDETKVESMRQAIAARGASEEREKAFLSTIKIKKLPVAFILSSPRSGSTLLRVMLAGHPRLFSPPELALLNFQTLGERRAAYIGRDSGWLEGALRAVMEARNCGFDEAQRIIDECEEQNITTQEFYKLIDEWLGGRRIVDKTTTYALSLQTLHRAESYFTDARYIHLVRRPDAMIQSYHHSKLDQVFGYSYPFTIREKAELFWLVANRNITEFFKLIPPKRCHFVKFEDLVQDPRSVMEELCNFLSIDFHPEMLEPYQGKKMTDGVHPESRMVGDPRFHQRNVIDASAAERWQSLPSGDKLSPLTEVMAHKLGYGMSAENLSTAIIKEGKNLYPAIYEGEVPLSLAQQRLWVIDRMDSGSACYNISSAIRLRGELRILVLERCMNEIQRRHEILRTTFPEVNGNPMQRITKPQLQKLQIEDLTLFTEKEREWHSRQLVEAESSFHFDLANGPLLRIKLLCLKPDEHILLFTLHHIICDGWSIGILIREFVALYDAYSREEDSPLENLSLQYADYAIWQRDWLKDNVFEPQLDYWKRQLAGMTILELPTDKSRSPVQAYHGAMLSFGLSSELSSALKKLCRSEGATLFMLLIAAFQILLAHYTKQKDICLGTDIAGRNRKDLEGLIGFFVNILLIRTDLRRTPSFRHMLRSMCETVLGALANQDLPFDKLVEALRPERKLISTPLFQVLFVYQNIPRVSLQLPGLTLSRLEIDNHITQFDLTLFISDEEQGIEGCFRYRTDLFDHSTIALMSARFKTLLESIVNNPEANIDDLNILTNEETAHRNYERATRKQEQHKLIKHIKRPHPISVNRGEIVRVSNMWPEEGLPLLIEPEIKDVELVEWAKAKRKLIEAKLTMHGAILFRGFDINSIHKFEEFAGSVCLDLYGEYGDLPREKMSSNVYGSTPYPTDQHILFHNESSHLSHWPMKIWFFCVTAAEQGGETPIVDCREVYRRLDPKIIERFERLNLMYVRNYTEGLDVSWQRFFGSSDRSVVENACRRSAIEFEWKSEGSNLRTRQFCNATSLHPVTGEKVFFNQIFLHHISCLDTSLRQSLCSVFGEEDYPRNVYYGDGSKIEDSVVDEIRAVYNELARGFAWQEGDILMLDNMLVAHGRNPYLGARKIVVALGEVRHQETIRS